MDHVEVPWNFILGIMAIGFVSICLIAVLSLKGESGGEKERKRKEWKKIIHKLLGK